MSRSCDRLMIRIALGAETIGGTASAAVAGWAG